MNMYCETNYIFRSQILHRFGILPLIKGLQLMPQVITAPRSAPEHHKLKKAKLAKRAKCNPCVRTNVTSSQNEAQRVYYLLPPIFCVCALTNKALAFVGITLTLKKALICGPEKLSKSFQISSSCKKKDL